MGQAWQRFAFARSVSVTHVSTGGVRVGVFHDASMLLGSPAHELKVPGLQGTISERGSTVRPSAISNSVRSALFRS